MRPLNNHGKSRKDQDKRGDRKAPFGISARQQRDSYRVHYCVVCEYSKQYS